MIIHKTARHSWPRNVHTHPITVMKELRLIQGLLWRVIAASRTMIKLTVSNSTQNAIQREWTPIPSNLVIYYKKLGEAENGRFPTEAIVSECLKTQSAWNSYKMKNFQPKILSFKDFLPMMKNFPTGWNLGKGNWSFHNASTVTPLQCPISTTNQWETVKSGHYDKYREWEEWRKERRLVVTSEFTQRVLEHTQ